MSDTIDTAGRLAGFDMAALRGVFGPAAVDVGGIVILAALFLVAALAVAIPASLAIMRLVDWARLNAILRRMARGDNGSTLVKQLDRRS